MTTLTRYPFPVRPRHYETLDSYSERLLGANFGTRTHKQQLLAAARQEHPNQNTDTLWAEIITARTGRNTTHLSAPHRTPPAHPDGTTCPACTAGIDNRYLCHLCAHGDTIRQHTHFAHNVCVRHHRWIGPGATPEYQTPVDAATVRAERSFRKLRRQNRIDAPLYMTIRRALTGLSTAQTSPATDARIYSDLIRIAAAITSDTFTREFYNPTRSFADAHAHLTATITGILGRPDATATRLIWLHLRPTALSVRESVLGNRPFTAFSPHDIPPNRSVLAQFPRPTSPLEPFAAFLTVTGDDTLTPTNYHDVLTHYAAPHDTDATAPRGSRPTICRAGHRGTIVSRLSRHQRNFSDDCPVCDNPTPHPGENDFSTTHPRIAAEWDHTRNAPLRPEDVAPGSATIAAWTCPTAGHRYRMSVRDRTRGRGCNSCATGTTADRALATARPDLAAELHPTANKPRTANDITTTSQLAATWICPSGHTYEQRAERRTSGYACPHCSGKYFRAGTNDTATLHPEIASEWNHRRNGTITPADNIPKSRTVWWTCAAAGHTLQHSTQHRIDNRGCPDCDLAMRITNMQRTKGGAGAFTPPNDPAVK